MIKKCLHAVLIVSYIQHVCTFRIFSFENLFTNYITQNTHVNSFVLDSAVINSEHEYRINLTC